MVKSQHPRDEAPASPLFTYKPVLHRQLFMIEKEIFKMFYIDNSDTAFLMGDNTLFLYSFMNDNSRRDERKSDDSKKKADK